MLFKTLHTVDHPEWLVVQALLTWPNSRELKENQQKTQDREASLWGKIKGTVYNGAKGQMNWDMKSIYNYLKNVNTKVEEKSFSTLKGLNWG